MSAAKHTPGPWRIRGRLGFGHHIVSNSESPSGQIAVAYGECNPDGEANAKLIAAAPALADALEDAAKHCAALHGAKYREHSCGTCTKWLFALNAAGRLP